MLYYIATDPQVQIAFLLAFTLCFIGFLINYRISKYQRGEQEEKKEQRRERYMAIENKPRPTDIEH